MKTKQIDEKTYYMSDDGIIMFSLYKPEKALHSIDTTTDEMWCVKCMYPTSHFGTWKFFEQTDAEAWIEDQIDLDRLNFERRRKEIESPKRSIEDVLENFVQVLAEINGIKYGN